MSASRINGRRDPNVFREPKGRWNLRPSSQHLGVLVIDQQPQLRGISWLLHQLFFSDAFGATGGTKSAFLLPEHAETLLSRCYSAATSIDRRDATHIVGALIDHQVHPPRSLIPYLDVLTRWLDTADATAAYAIGNLINSLWSMDKALARQLVESVQPVSIAARLAEAQCPQCHAWGHLLGRLWCAARDEWRTGLQRALPRDHMLDLAANFNPEQIGHLAELLQGLAAYDREFATECLRKAMPVVQQSFRADPLEAFAEAQDIRWFLLRHDPFDRWRP